MPDESRWALIRLDDNGNEIEVQCFDCRADAEAARRRFEARGHKQAWFVRQADPH